MCVCVFSDNFGWRLVMCILGATSHTHTHSHTHKKLWDKTPAITTHREAYMFCILWTYTVDQEGNGSGKKQMHTIGNVAQGWWGISNSNSKCWLSLTKYSASHTIIWRTALMLAMTVAKISQWYLCLWFSMHPIVAALIHSADVFRENKVKQRLQTLQS